MHVLTDYLLLQLEACLSVVRVRPSAPNGSLSDELSVPQVLGSLSSDLLTQNTPNVNRSSQLITNLRSVWLAPMSQSRAGEARRA